MMKRASVATIAALISVALSSGVALAAGDAESQIRALEDQYAAAVNAKDVDKIMACYVPDESLFVFDVIPPRQYVGAKAYAKDWTDFLGMLKGSLKFEISDLSVTADGTMGFGHSI